MSKIPLLEAVQGKSVIKEETHVLETFISATAFPYIEGMAVMTPPGTYKEPAKKLHIKLTREGILSLPIIQLIKENLEPCAWKIAYSSGSTLVFEKDKKKLDELAKA
ncbi:MAG: hypothetical protein HZA34_04275 [Candidatus Pacebacteria bacterium]|nr:hypothetical protein [Candidatus Paceibacterota bacterium]